MNVVRANQEYVNKMIGDVSGMKVLLLDKDTVSFIPRVVDHLTVL